MRDELKDYNEAMRFFFEASRLETENALYTGSAARVMVTDRSKVRPAAELYNKVIQQDPKRREFYLELGELLQRSGLPTRARRIYESGLQRLPNDPELKQHVSQVTAAADKARRN